MASRVRRMPPIKVDEYRWRSPPNDPRLRVRRACATEAMFGIEASNQNGENDFFIAATVHFYASSAGSKILTLRDLERMTQSSLVQLRVSQPQVAVSLSWDKQGKCMLQYRTPKVVDEVHHWAASIVTAEAKLQSPIDMRDQVEEKKNQESSMSNNNAITVYISSPVTALDAALENSEVHYLFRFNHCLFDGIAARQIVAMLFQSLVAEMSDSSLNKYEDIDWKQSASNLPPAFVELMDSEQDLCGPRFDRTVHDHMALMKKKNELKTRIQELESLVTNHVTKLSPQTLSTPASSSQVAGSLPISQTVSSFYPASLRFQKLFLDSDIQTRPDAPPPPSSDMIPAAALSYLSDQAQGATTMSQYFETVHKWMPIISRVRLTSLADVELNSRPRADFALLLLAMKLIQHVPGSSSDAVKDCLYICTKEFAASLDIAGVYTLLKLQAQLLITVYEMGHGIFPAAYVSIGCCVTQAMALGIHNREAPQILEPPRTWIDWEERQRIWWFIVILERYVNSVGDNRPLLSADPQTTSHLPVDDDAWDSGQAMYPERLILSSSKHLSASPFARLAQASHLQGEVIKHCNDETQSLSHVKNSVEVLSQVLLSFLEVISKDRGSMMHFYSSVGVCLSALMKLCDHHSCDSFAIYNDRSLDVSELALAREIALTCQSIMKDCIVKAMSFLDVLREMIQDQESTADLASLSPWFLDSLYQCLANIVYLMATSPAVGASEYPSQASLCLDLLRKANQRWNVAGAYLETIDLIEKELKSGRY
ncbi:hypothetical protein FP744_10009164 [Trichoderma asperellum]